MNWVFNIKLNVKPVFPFLAHSGVYEGPCRVGKPEDLSPEEERRRAKMMYKEFCREVRENLPSNAEMLEPAFIEWSEDWVVPEEELDKVKGDIGETDLFLVARTSSPQYPSISLAHKFGKPVAMVGQVSSIDVAAYLRARGLEGYSPIDFEDLRRLISLLWVRKAVRNSRVLIVTEENPLPVGVVSSIMNLENIKRRFGLDYRCIPSREIFEEMDEVSSSVEHRERAEAITDNLIENAEAVHMKRDYVLSSVIFYLAAKSLMNKYRCNAFVIPCFEICAKRIPEKKKVTFCLAHSLLKDEGFPSACEGDLNVLLSMMLLMYVSGKSAYMGNSYVIDKERNVMALHHDVPGLKMKGFNEPNLPYEVRSFTYGGWGATIRYDFSRDNGETVTMARFDPKAERLLIIKGEIVGCGGFDEVGCKLRAHIKVSNIVDLFHKEADFGHHLAMVYGDYTNEIKELSKIMGFEIVEA